MELTLLKPFLRPILLLSLSLIPGLLYAASESSQLFPDHGRVSAGALGASNSASSGIGVFGGDAMLPLYGNDNGFLYGDFGGDGGTDSTWLVSPGLGVRYVRSNNLAGLFLFGDYQEVSLNQKFWVLNPGFEWMTPHWDAHLNGYFPTSNTEQNGARDFASNLGDYNQVTFVGHDQYDQYATPVAFIGDGFDSEIGYSFPYKNKLRARAYIGDYFYFTAANVLNVNQIRGVSGGVNLALSRYTNIGISDSYDNLNKNTVGLTVSFSLGNDDNEYSTDVHSRLLAPITRHVGIVNTGAGEYAQNGLTDLGPETLQFSNIWFFDGSSSSSDAADTISSAQCTAEHPCAASLLTSSSLNDINAIEAGARIYLAGGATYSPGASGLTVLSGQSIWGRTANFTQAASGSARPTIDTTLLLDGSNTADSLQINGATDAGYQAGIDIESSATGTIAISNDAVTSTVNGAALNAIGVYDDSAATVNITDSTITAEQGTNNQDAYALNFSNSSGTTTVDNSTLTAETVAGATDTNRIFTYGIRGINGGGTAIIQNNTTINSTINNDQNPRTAYGIYASTYNVTVNNSSVSVAANSASGTARGLFIPNASTNITFNNSTLTSNTSGSGNDILVSQGANSTTAVFAINNSTLSGTSDTGTVYGVFLSTLNGTINIANSTINVTNTGNGTNYGLYYTAAGTPTYSVTNSSINANGTPGQTFAVEDADNKITTMGSTCTENGSTVAC